MSVFLRLAVDVFAAVYVIYGFHDFPIYFAQKDWAVCVVIVLCMVASVFDAVIVWRFA